MKSSRQLISKRYIAINETCALQFLHLLESTKHEPNLPTSSTTKITGIMFENNVDPCHLFRRYVIPNYIQGIHTHAAYRALFCIFEKKPETLCLRSLKGGFCLSHSTVTMGRVCTWKVWPTYAAAGMGGSRLRVENRGRWRFWGCESRGLGEADWRFGGLFTSLYIYINYIQYASNFKSMIGRFHSGKGAGPLFKWSTREALRKH